MTRSVEPSVHLAQLGEHLAQLREQFAKLCKQFAQLGEQFAQFGQTPHSSLFKFGVLHIFFVFRKVGSPLFAKKKLG